jgi:hypothetical protein
MLKLTLGRKLKMRKSKPIIIGASAAIGLLIVYLGIVTLANSFSHALEQLAEMWYWITLLVTGFGIQIALYAYARINLREKAKVAKAEVATAGTISTGSMIACCAHHIADVLPILGLSAAALFLVRYQVSLILLGIFSNLIGITVMLGIIQKHGLYSKSSIFESIFNYNMRTARNVVGILAIMIVSLSFFLSPSKATDSIMPADDSVMFEEVVKLDLPAKVNSENFVSIEVKPEDFSPGKSVKFDVSMNTHRGSLDFDLAEISLLEDDKGNVYKPLSWEGSSPGGHHRNGTLTFPELKEKSRSIKLTIRDVYDVPERIFEWELL